MLVGACSYHSRNVSRKQCDKKCYRKGNKCQYLIMGVIIKEKPKPGRFDAEHKKQGLPSTQDPV
jgi:hypothetical protein